MADETNREPDAVEQEREMREQEREAQEREPEERHPADTSRQFPPDAPSADAQREDLAQ
jgi:hypothetical protein